MGKCCIMGLTMSISDMFEEWLNEIRPLVPLGDEGISNRERYTDILDPLSIAFEAGFNYQRRKALEKLSELDQELGLG